MINKYIKDLLNEHSRVIVPDLGAFLHKGESTKILYFNEFLRFNDGLLLNHIAEQEKIDKIEAAKQIKAYVEETNKILQSKKKVNIKDIGYLYLDNNEKIQLEVSGSAGFREDESQKPSVDKTETEFSHPEDPLLIIEKPIEEPKTEFIPPIQPISEAVIKEQKAERTSPAVKPTQTKTTTRRTQLKPPPKAKSNKVILWIASIIVLVILSLVYYFIIKPLYSHTGETKHAVITNTNLDTIITTKTDSVEDMIKPAQKATPAIPMSASNGKKFHLVVGCFVQENNADKVVQKLRDEGYASEKFAKIEQMYFVSIASFADKTSAENQLRDLKTKGHTEIWIKYY